jgi:hypothetical protein
MMQLPDACGSLPPLLVRLAFPVGLAAATAQLTAALMAIFFSHPAKHDPTPAAPA